MQRGLYWFGLVYAIIGAFLAAYGYAQSLPRPPVVNYHYLPRTLDVTDVDRSVLKSLQSTLDTRAAMLRNRDTADDATPLERDRLRSTQASRVRLQSASSSQTNTPDTS